MCVCVCVFVPQAASQNSAHAGTVFCECATAHSLTRHVRATAGSGDKNGNGSNSNSGTLNRWIISACTLKHTHTQWIGWFCARVTLEFRLNYNAITFVHTRTPDAWHDGTEQTHTQKMCNKIAHSTVGRVPLRIVETYVNLHVLACVRDITYETHPFAYVFVMNRSAVTFIVRIHCAPWCVYTYVCEYNRILCMHYVRYTHILLAPKIPSRGQQQVGFVMLGWTTVRII